ncbi:MAG: hypothetical protein IKB38_04745 [Clostridia bacterium]|nr:hypothetical protein [Clostridia bacterium]
MKRRIISLVLAVAVLFSCLALNVFASDEPVETDATESTTHKLTVDELKAAVGSDLVYACDFDDFTITANGNYNVGGDNGVIMNGGGTFKTVTQDGNTYIKQGAMAADGIAADGFFQITNTGKNTVANVNSLIANNDKSVNASYVVSFDYAKLEAGRTHRIISEIRTYTGAGNTTVAWSDVLLTDSAGYLNYNAGGTLVQYQAVQFEVGRFYNIVFHHTPKTNSYDVYIDGELVLDGIKALGDDVYALLYDGIFMPGYVRGDSKHNKWGGADLYALDNVKMYYGDTNLECAHNVVDNVCEWCGKAFGVHTHGINSTITPDKLSGVVAGEDLVYACDFDDFTITANGNYNVGGDNGVIMNGGGTFKTVTQDGNTYIKQGAMAADGIAADGYFQITNIGKNTVANVNSLIANSDKSVNASYVISFDYAKLEAGRTHRIISEIRTYTGAGNTNLAWSDVLLTDSAGYLNYSDGGVLVQYQAVQFEVGRFYNIVFHHTPKTNSYDVYIDGELVLDDIKALSDDVYALLYDGIFMPGYVRGDSKHNKWGGADLYALDNVKMYYSDTNLECAHSYTDSFACDWCGAEAELDFCNTCGGGILSEGAAVVSKSVSLGETIDINVYMKLAKTLLVNEEAKIVLECGDKKAEYALKDVLAEENGLYKFTIELTSIRMTAPVKVTVVGESSNVYVTSVQDYANDLIEISENESEIALAKALLNFGAAAQEYFAVRNADDALDDVLANEGLDAADKEVPELTAADLADYKFSANGMTADVQYTGATLTFSSKTYLKVYFTASADATVTVNGKAYTKVSDGEGYYVALSASTPQKAMTAFEIVITDGDAVASADISVFTAIHAALANETTDSKLVSLITAYARYCQLTSAYLV